MKRIVAMLVIFASGIMVACGQKGPLYLPDNPSQIRVDAPAASENEQERDEEDDDDER